MGEVCGTPRPEGLVEWTGCLLFHDLVHLSLMGTVGVFALGWWLGAWQRRRQIAADIEAYVASWGDDHSTNFAEGMAFAAYMVRRGHHRRPKPKAAP